MSRNRQWAVLSLFALVLATSLLSLVAPVERAVGQAESDLSLPVRETIVTRDNKQLAITYYKSNGGKDAPVVVCLHERDGSRFVWQTKNGLAESLQKAGMAVVTLDFREHGESREGGGALPVNANADPKNKKKDSKKPAKPESTLKPGDYQAMVAGDMEAVKKFLFDKHQAEELNMSRLGLVGAEMGASVAVNFALLDWLKEPFPDGVGLARTPRGQDVRAIAMISPQTNFPGLPITKPLGDLKSPAFNVAFFVGVSKGDSKDKGQAKKIFDQVHQGQAELPAEQRRVYLSEFPGGLHGTQLLGQPRINMEGLLVAFFSKHLKSVDIPWRDRRSKLNRDE